MIELFNSFRDALYHVLTVLPGAGRTDHGEPELLVLDRPAHGRRAHPAHPAHREAGQVDAGHAGARPRDQEAPGQAQERQDEAERGNDGALQGARLQPHGRLLAAPRSDAVLLRPLPGHLRPADRRRAQRPDRQDLLRRPPAAALVGPAGLGQDLLGGRPHDPDADHDDVADHLHLPAPADEQADGAGEPAAADDHEDHAADVLRVRGQRAAGGHHLLGHHQLLERRPAVHAAPQRAGAARPGPTWRPRPQGPPPWSTTARAARASSAR